MKTTTTTREFDDAGRCVKETVVEYVHGQPRCSCIPNVYGYDCPLHGRRSPQWVYTPYWARTGGYVSISPATKTFTVN